MKIWLAITVVVVGLFAWLYSAMWQTYGSYGPVRRASCMSQLKQIARAGLLYSEAYDGRLMLSRNWADVLTTADSQKRHTVLPASCLKCPCVLGEGAFEYGYAYNSRLAAKRVTDFQTPEQTPFFYESTRRERNASDPFSSFSGPYDPDVTESGRANVVYLTAEAKRLEKGKS